jgi:hypothetical protein
MPLLHKELERMCKKTAPGLLQSKKFVFYYVFNLVYLKMLSTAKSIGSNDRISG